MKTPLAQKEFENVWSRNNGKHVHVAFYFHYPRLIASLGDVEDAEEILNDPEVTSLHIPHHGRWNYDEGIGSSEALRGTLFQHYHTD